MHSAYYLNGGIENARPAISPTYFFFSVETIATIGYGKMSPVTIVSQMLMSVEALCGLINFALITGLIFAKFSRPTARVRFSRIAVISKRDGVPSLMFRMANVRSSQIVDAQIHVAFSRDERTREGEYVRRFYDLDLVALPQRRSSPTHGPRFTRFSPAARSTAPPPRKFSKPTRTSRYR